MIGVEYTGLKPILTSFSGHKIVCREAILASITLENKVAPSELIAVCSIPEPVRELLRRQGVEDRIIIGVYT